MTKNKNLLSLFIFIFVLLFQTNVNAGQPSIERIRGDNRYETCYNVVTNGWQEADYAILVNGEMFADAITSAPLSKKYDAPILLTTNNKLDKNARNKLQLLKVKQVFIIGGESVLNKNIEKELKEMNIKVERIAGKNRYETSLKMADYFKSTHDAFVVDGTTWEYALMVAPVSASKQAPIILTNPKETPKIVSDYANNNFHIYNIIGTDSFVSNKKVVDAFHTQKTLSGASKENINSNIIERYKEDLNKSSYGIICSDLNFPDALSASALASKYCCPIYLTNKYNIISIKNNINNNNINKLFCVGGKNIISDEMVSILVDKNEKVDSNTPSKNKIKDYENKLMSVDFNSLDEFYDFIGKDNANKLKNVYTLLKNASDKVVLSKENKDSAIILFIKDRVEWRPEGNIMLEYNMKEKNITLTGINDHMFPDMESWYKNLLKIFPENQEIEILKSIMVIDDCILDLEKTKKLEVMTSHKSAGFGEIPTTYGNYSFGIRYNEQVDFVDLVRQIVYKME